MKCQPTSTSWKRLCPLVCGFAASLVVFALFPSIARGQPLDVNPPVLDPEKSLAHNPNYDLKPADPRAIIIPESAFREAFETAGAFAVDEATKQEATSLNAQANEPGAIGIVGDVVASPTRSQEFYGTLFIVVEDPAFALDRRTVESRRFRIVAAELRGTSPWLATSSRIAIARGQVQEGPRNCCGPITLCVEPAPGPSPCAPATGMLCPSRDVGVVSGQVPGPLEERIGQHLSNIALMLYPTVGPSSARDAHPQVIEACSRVVVPGCDKVKPLCGIDDPGYIDDGSGSGDADGGSASCGPSTPVRGGRVPKMCTIGLWTPESLPPACGGFSGTLTGNYMPSMVPPGCTAMKPETGGEVPGCTPANPQLEKAQLAAQIGWVQGMGDHEQCTTGKHGIKTCIACTDKDGCQQTVTKPPVDPGIADEDPEAAGSPNCSGYPGKCEEVEFKDDTIIARSPETNESETKTKTTDPPSPSPDQRKESPGSGPSLSQPEATEYTVNFGEETIIGKIWNKNTVSFGEGTIIEIGEKKPGEGRPSGTAKKGDPILLANGGLVNETTDLSFAGPVRALEFRRSYTSRNEDRSVLGSNWQHNWDVRVERLRPETTPSWAAPFCLGTDATPSCVVLHTGDGASRLFFYDTESRLYLPQAGSTDTLGVTTDGGFSLRTADGGILTFNATGQLVEDRDRFGNGFIIEVENTPIYDLYVWFCELPKFAPPLRPPRVPARGTGIGGGADAAYVARRCSVLSWLIGDGAKPLSTDPAWAISLADYLPIPSIAFGLGRAEDGRAHLLALLATGFDARHAYGARKQRVTKVTDDLGRSLVFTYWTPQNHDYAGLLQADLLRDVSGPAGTKVSFEYSRPANYPAKLGEMFLTKAQRHDDTALDGVVPAADRTFEYRYQWPGGSALSYDSGQNRDRVRDAFRAYYEKFVGCLAAYELCIGHSGKTILVPGNPTDLADAEADAYVSRVADNISEWVADGVVRTESRYQVDPFSSAGDFDRTTAQRYGSSHATQAAPPPDAPADNWRTSLPKAVFAYASAGPSAAPSSDRTDAFLPEEIRNRYSLETWTPTVELPPDPPVVPAVATGGGAPLCSFGDVETARLALPEQFPTVPYYTPEPAERHPNFGAPIRRTHLTCEQIAEAQLNDPLHNEVVSALEPITSTLNPFDWKAIRVIGGRHRVAADSNRICAWTSVQDRDGNLSYQGLNYRGQVRVDALKMKRGSGWRYNERLYNADGMLVQDRRPLTSETPWSVDAGYTAYFYEEIDPSGNNGANSWLPAFWSRRQNLVRVEEYPATGKVVNAIEAAPGSAPSAIALVESLGRYRRFTYEPLFNQLKAIETGSIETGTVDGLTGPRLVPHERIDIIYDYQELDPLGLPEKSAVPLLQALEPWGFAWRRKGVDGKDYDFDIISTWQLPLAFFGTDLNGDGRTGFSAGAPWARGVPILVTRRPAGSPPDAGEKLAIAWTPHGQPALIVGSNGAMQRFDYYPAQRAPDAVYGTTTPPGPDAAGAHRRGFPARVSTLRFDNAYDPAAAPSGASCTKLAGPYQWLLPAGCSDIHSELRAIGLAPQAVQAIVAASTSDSPERWLTESFTYTELGAPRHRWDANGGTWTFLRDTDGWSREIERPIGAKLVIDLTPDGIVRRETEFDAQGNVLSDLLRHLDEDGDILHECRAKTAGGCDPPGPTAASAVETSFEYTPEGLLCLEIDPEGLRTETFYDERGLPVRRKIDHETRPVQPRWELRLYNPDGNVTYSSLRETVVPIPNRIVIEETFFYDGLQRLITHRDTRGYFWQFAHSPRNLLVRAKHNDAPYAVGGPASGSPSREDEYRYDDFGRFRESYQNGLLTARFNLAAFGLVRSSTSLGRGVTQITQGVSPSWGRAPCPGRSYRIVG
jgi:hypothetical protein